MTALTCRYGCAGEARLYLGGRLCAEHRPRPVPPPPPAGTTLAERRGWARPAAEGARRG